MPAEPDTVLIERRDTTALVTLNRPQALNAVNTEMREALIAALAELNRDDTIRAVIITGAGERAFSSGQDLNETARYSVGEVDQWLSRQHAMYRAVHCCVERGGCGRGLSDRIVRRSARRFS